ncbi:TPA: GatB/YqeY domain-containing protein [bacterium]|nr:GatB/YqeY domain-containing protein [bacterium]
MLLNELKKANMDALRSKDSNARAIYSVLINKCDMLAIEKRRNNEELTDLDVVLTIQKTLKELQEEKENFEKVNNTERVSLLTQQEKLLEKFLPKMLSEDEIVKEIESLEDKSIPSVMKHFKANHAGKVDMKEVSNIARRYQG